MTEEAKVIALGALVLANIGAILTAYVSMKVSIAVLQEKVDYLQKQVRNSFKENFNNSERD